MQQRFILAICFLFLTFVASFSQKLTPLSISAPKGVKASDGDYPDKIKVSWEEIAGRGVFYQVKRKDVGIIKDSVTGPFIGDYDKNIKPGQKYYYSVRAKRGKETSEWSDEDSGYIEVVAGGQPPEENLSFSIEALQVPPDSLLATYTASNIDTNGELKFYLSKGTVYDATKDELLYSIELRNLAPLSIKQERRKLKLKETLPNGEYFLILVNGKYSVVSKKIIIQR